MEKKRLTFCSRFFIEEQVLAAVDDESAARPAELRLAVFIRFAGNVGH